MSTAEKSYLSPTEYLAIERSAEIKSEFFNGEMFAMTGASRKHNLIAGNTFSAVHSRIEDRPCEAYASDMRVKVSETGLYTYPDIAVTCQQPVFEDKELDTLLNPQVIIEILSESTEGYDRGKKFEHYRNIDSMKEYVLIAQDRCHVERWGRRDEEPWTLWESNDLDATLELDSIDCKLRIADIYSKVDLSDEPESPTP